MTDLFTHNKNDLYRFSAVIQNFIFNIVHDLSRYENFAHIKLMHIRKCHASHILMPAKLF